MAGAAGTSSPPQTQEQSWERVLAEFIPIHEDSEADREARHHHMIKHVNSTLDNANNYLLRSQFELCISVFTKQ